MRVVLAIAVIVALSYLLGLLARRLGQPAVIGQLFAGIALGPSLLGRLPGRLSATLFPHQILPYLTVVAQIALILFLFSVGYELDRRLLRGRVRAVPFVVTAGFMVPMLLGTASTVAFGTWYAATGTTHASHGTFVLFVGVALAITAVPVLAGIIEERNLGGTVAGVVAMTSAGVIDALGWLALAGVLLGASGGAHRPWPVTVTLLIGYLAVLLLVLRPALRRWMQRSRSSPSAKLPVVATFAMASAWVTGALGLHVIIGAFLAGLVMPRRPDGTPQPELLGAMEKAGGVLLPVFFVVSGLSTDIGSLRRADVGLFAVVCVIATAGKLGAAMLAARASNLSWHESAVVGALLNTRGLTELGGPERRVAGRHHRPAAVHRLRAHGAGHDRRDRSLAEPAVPPAQPGRAVAGPPTGPGFLTIAQPWYVLDAASAMPPRTLKFTVTLRNTGSSAATMSSRIFVARCSWKTPSSRYVSRYSFRLLVSTPRSPGR